MFGNLLQLEVQLEVQAQLTRIKDGGHFRIVSIDGPNFLAKNFVEGITTKNSILFASYSHKIVFSENAIKIIIWMV